MTVLRAPYNLRELAGPSVSGPFTRYSHYDQKAGAEFEIGAGL